MKKTRKLMWYAIMLLALMGVGLVFRRLLILFHVIPAVPAGTRFVVDTGLKNHPLLTLVHIIPGLIFVLLSPVLLKLLHQNKKSGNLYILSWLFICSSFVIGLSAIIMPFITMPIGGINEACASELFGIIFLLACTRLANATQTNNLLAYREWLLRCIAIGLAIATTRLIMVLAFAVGKVSPQEFLGTAFWIAFTIHLYVAETWIYYRRTMGIKHA